MLCALIRNCWVAPEAGARRHFGLVSEEVLLGALATGVDLSWGEPVLELRTIEAIRLRNCHRRFREETICWIYCCSPRPGRTRHSVAEEVGGPVVRVWPEMKQFSIFTLKKTS